ncbi:MAG: hypothetical protein ACE5SW_10995 [Nitrososphaeraceae archaeon]
MTNTLAMLVVTSTILVLSLVITNQTFGQVDKTDWVTSETETITFEHPPDWSLTLPTSKFDTQDFQLKHPQTNMLIQGSTGHIESEYLRENPDMYYDSWLIGATSEMIDSYKVESYPYGEITIGELPAYSELYASKIDYLSDDKYGILISMSFFDDNSRYYTLMSGGPVTHYEEMEPIMLEIIRSITLKD